MKASLIAVAAAMVAGASAHNNHAGAHAKMHKARSQLSAAVPAPSANATCGECYTVWQYEWEGKTYTVPPPSSTTVVVASSSVPVPAVSSSQTAVTMGTKSSLNSTSAVAPTTTSVYSTYVPPATGPTPIVTTCPTPGTYTFPATTVTITESTTVCGATTTKVPAGPATYGGVTTVVVEATTVVCPYAAVVTSAGVVTSTILTTTYVCPSAGTYTPVPPTTTTCAAETVIVYPVPMTYGPGTYTAPATVVTATATDYVYYCPLESSTWVPASTPSAVSTASVAVTSSIAASTTAATTSAVAVTSSTAVSSTSSSIGGSAKISSNGNKWAITYTPYNDDAAGSCKSRTDVFADISAIAAMGFASVRIYSTDCSGLTNIGDACAASGLKLIVGVFIDAGGISKAQSQVTDLTAFVHWDLVEMVVVGNEAVFNGYCSASELMAFVATCRSAFVSVGYTGLVTITEPLNVWEANKGTFCDGVDIVGSTMHPFFNAAVTAELAGVFASAQLEIAGGLCPGKAAVNLECGWPSAGSCNGDACPGTDAQKIAVEAIVEACGDKTVIYSFSNDAWKAPGEFDCEQYWGVSQLF